MKNISDLTMADYDLLPNKEQCKAFEEAVKIIDKNIFFREATIKFVLYFETEKSSYSESDNFIESLRDFIKRRPMSFPSAPNEPMPYLSDNGFVNTKAEATAIRDPESVEMIEEWLKENTIASDKPFPLSSYSLKHRVEKELGKYVTNGAFIQACLNIGYHVDRIEGGSNGHIYADFSDMNIIKIACKITGLSYKQLGEHIGYSEDTIKGSASKGKISEPMERAIILYMKTLELEKELEKTAAFKAAMKSFLQ